MYKVDELIKCCKIYPQPHTIKDLTWLECECCRKRTVNTFKDIKEAGLRWNEMMLKVRDPRRSIQGKQAILSMLDERNLTMLEVAEIAGIKKTSINKVISRIREEIDVEDSEGEEDSEV